MSNPLNNGEYASHQAHNHEADHGVPENSRICKFDNLVPERHGEKSKDSKTKGSRKPIYDQQLYPRVIQCADGGDDYREWKWRRNKGGDQDRYARPGPYPLFEAFISPLASHFFYARFTEVPRDQVEKENSNRGAGRSGQNIERKSLVMSRNQRDDKDIVPKGQEKK